MGEWDIAAQSRRDFADMIEGLSEEQLGAATLCDGWTARDVAGHVVSFTQMSMPTMFLSMLKGGFNVDKAWTANATKSFPPELTTTDVVVHTQDIRRPLGLDGAPSEAAIREALDFCTAHKKGKLQVPSKDIAGLRLEASDIDWSWGEGKQVSGPAEAILMAINRRDTRSELTGDGVSSLPVRKG